MNSEISNFVRDKAKIRSLGTTRSSLDSSSTKFPPLLKTSIDYSYEGILGNAMTVPPRRQSLSEKSTESNPESPVAQKKLLKKGNKSSDSISSNRTLSDSRLKELQELSAREKQIAALKAQISELQKTIIELNTQISSNAIEIQELKKKIIDQEKTFQNLYNSEKSQHENTCVKLREVKNDLNNCKAEMVELRSCHVVDLENLRNKFQQEIKQVTSENKREIEIRDKNLSKLKQQMAEALKGNSWERQQQLDELTKELGRVQEEASTYRAKLQSLQKHTSTKLTCSNCNLMEKRLSNIDQQLSDKDQTIQELTNISSKFERQLSKQNKLLKMFSEESESKKM